MKRQSSSPLEPSSQPAAAVPAPAPTPSIAPAPATGTDLASSPSPPPAATPLKSVPVTIISGFLIAGKTLLSYASTAHHGPRIVVIDNEVGGEIDVKSLIVVDGDNGNVFEKSTSTATAALAARCATTLPTRSNGPPSPAKPDSAESRPRTRRKEAPAGPVFAAAARDRVAPVRDVIHQCATCSSTQHRLRRSKIRALNACAASCCITFATSIESSSALKRRPRHQRMCLGQALNELIRERKY